MFEQLLKEFLFGVIGSSKNYGYYWNQLLSTLPNGVEKTKGEDASSQFSTKTIINKTSLTHDK